MTASLAEVEADPDVARGVSGWVGARRRSETGEAAVRREEELSGVGYHMGIDIVGLLAVFSIFFVPITGLMLILTTRFAFKPLVESLAKALRESGHTQEAERFSPNQELTLQVELLRDEVRRLKEVQEFDKKLLESVSSKDIDFSV
jgi:hypothetical protein